MGDGIRAYAGEFLISPAGLELSMNWCGHDCTYCFANLSKPKRRADIPQIIGLLSDYRNRKSREATLLQAGVPLLVSNHVDPFAGTNATQFEPIWELCVNLGIELTWQTRGAHKPQQPILDRIIANTPKSVWYISIPMIDDSIRQTLEPKAPSIGSRLDLVDQLIEAGHIVTVGINPLSQRWLPDYEPLIDRLKRSGVWGLWIQVPYFSKSFKGNLSENAKNRIGGQYIKDCGEYGDCADLQHSSLAKLYAKECGLEVFATDHEDPTRFFDPWHSIYKRPMPYWHQLVNAADESLDHDQDFVVITLEDAVSIMEPLPNIDYAEPLRHKRARHYRSLTQKFIGGPLPKQNAKGFWRIIWNDDLFAKSLGLMRFSRFAFAAIIEGDVITPLLDDLGNKLAVYKRTGFKTLYAQVDGVD
jgi:DNA repair photolyase